MKPILFFYKAKIMKGGRFLRPSGAEYKKGWRGYSWERLTKETISTRKSLRQKVVITFQGKASFSKTREALYWSRLAFVNKEGWWPCTPLWRKVLPEQVFFSLQPADFSCSCYTMSFQKNEGLWKIIKPMRSTAIRIREKRTMRKT